MNKVKELCIRRGITQKQLALTVGVSQPTVSDWFNNKTDPSGKRLEKLSEVLGVGRAVILGYDADPQAPSATIVINKDTNTERENDKINHEAQAILDSILNKLAKLDDDDRKTAEDHIDFLLSRKKGE